MANSYTIKKTNGDVAVTILAGGANGDSGIANGHDTDLLLYGRGTFNWGAGIEQNLVRLTENWAFPAANGTASTNQQYPAISSTTGEGIKKPIRGQTWFNTTNNKLYVNVNGSNNAGAWRVDHIDYKYLELPKTTDQAMEGKLRIRSSNHQPDLYLESTRIGWGVGTGAGGANEGASSFVTLEGTDPDGDRARGAFIANYHNNNTLRIALGDREYTELNTNTGLVEKKSYAGSAILNYIQLEATQTVVTHEIRQIGDQQDIGYGTGGIYFRALTTAEWVYHYVKDEAEGNVYQYGDPRYLKLGDTTARIQTDGDARYLKLSDTTARIQTDGDARYVQLDGDVMSGPLDLFYQDAAITLAAPFNPTTVDHNLSVNFQHGSTVLGEMYLLTGGDVTTDLVGTFDQSAYTTDSKLIIRKNDGGELAVNGFVIYDDEIRTHHTRGKIHTPLTVSGDADDTVTTKKYVDDKVSAVDLSDYYIKNDPLTITRSTGSINPAIYVVAEDIADITIETTGTSTDALGRLSFKTNGGYRGFVGMQTMSPTATEDTLIIRKQTSATTNEIQLQDDITQFKKRLTVIPNDGAVAPGLDLQCTKNNAAYDNWVNEINYDSDNSNGIIWKNSQGAVRGGIQHNNTNTLRISVTPTGGTTGVILSTTDTTHLELGTSLIKINKEMHLESDARPLSSDTYPDNYNLATNHGVVARTYRDYKRTTTAAAIHHIFSGGPTWNSLGGSNINATYTNTTTGSVANTEFPSASIGIGLMKSEALSQQSIRLDINIPAWVNTNTNDSSPALKSVPMNMEYLIVYDNAATSTWLTFTVCQVLIYANGSNQVAITGSPIIPIPNPDAASTLQVRFKLDDVATYSRDNNPYNYTTVGVGVIDSYWV